MAIKNHIATATITINAPASRVWQALTEPEMVRQFLFGTEMTTDWKVGSPITYRGEWQGKPYEDKGVVLLVEPEKHIVTTYWSAFSGLPDSPENYNKVEYVLESAGSATQLTINQDNNASEEGARHAEQNWQTVLAELKKLLEK